MLKKTSIGPFLEKDHQRFEKYALPEPNTGCWLWMAYVGRDGYGYMRIGNAKVGRRGMAAHRFSYQVHKGDIPDGLVIDHLCRVRSCCNPDHLEAVTIRENIFRGENICARKAKQTHCKNGHAFTPENTYTTLKGCRVCLACRRKYDHFRRRKVLHQPVIERTRCTKGHEFTSQSSWVDPSGRRMCRICNAKKARDYRLKLKLNSDVFGN